jgi:hypothetical protein
MSVPAYPLCWPDRFPRTPAVKREAGAFKTSLAGALKNVEDSLRRFATDSGKRLAEVTISSNVTLGAQRPADPGVSVWFTWDGFQVCIPVDRYKSVEANLQAIHHVLEARRTELRHGGLEITRATFQGFQALPEPGRVKPWHEVMDLPAHAPTDDVKAKYRELAKRRHPDAGGGHEAFAELGAAWQAFQKERGLA